MRIKSRWLYLLCFLLLAMSLLLCEAQGLAFAQNGGNVSLQDTESTLKMKVPFEWKAKGKDIEQEWYGKVKMKQWYQTHNGFHFHVLQTNFKDDFYRERLNEQGKDKEKLIKFLAKKYIDYMQVQSRKKNMELTVTNVKQGNLDNCPMIVFETSYVVDGKNMRGTYVFFLHGSNLWELIFYMSRENQGDYAMVQDIVKSVSFSGTGFDKGSNMSAVNENATEPKPNPKPNTPHENTDPNGNYKLLGAIVVLMGMLVTVAGIFLKKDK